MIWWDNHKYRIEFIKSVDIWKRMLLMIKMCFFMLVVIDLADIYELYSMGKFNEISIFIYSFAFASYFYIYFVMVFLFQKSLSYAAQYVRVKKVVLDEENF